MKLTNRERALLHLWDFTRDRERYNPRREVTQAGVTDALGTLRAVVSQTLARLKKEGALEVRSSRPEGARGLVKCYFLTPKGETEAKRLEGLLRDLDSAAGTGVDVRDRLIAGGLRHGLAVMRALEDEDGGSMGTRPSSDVSRSGDNGSGVDRAQTTPDQHPEAPLFGRGEELSEVASALDAGRSVLLLGVGGIGKTALARAAVAGREHVWIDWTATGSAAEAAARIARHLFRTEGRTLPEEPARLARELETRPPSVLIVLDDHSAGADIDRLLGSLRSSGRLLLTSRQRPAFWQYPFAVGRGTDGPGMADLELHLGPLDRSGAGELLDALGIKGDAARVVEEAAGGHPLALQVAARFGPREARLEVMQLIYRAVSQSLVNSEVDALRRLASIDGSIDPECAVRAGLATYFEVAALRDKSILAPEPTSSGTLRIHDVIRDLFRTPAAPDTAARYHLEADTPASLLKAARASLAGSGEVLLTVIHRDLGRIAEQGLAGEMAAVLAAAQKSWAQGRRPSEDIASVRLAIAQLEIPLGGDPLGAIGRIAAEELDPSRRGEYHRTLGNALFLNGDRARAEEELRRAVEISRGRQDDASYGRAAISLMNFYAQSKRPGELFALFSEAEQTLTSLGDWYLLRALHNLSIFLLDAGLLDKAETVIARALAEGERSGDLLCLANAHNLQAHLLLARGSLDEAERSAARMEKIMLGAGYALGVAYALEAQAIAASRRGEVERSETRFLEAVRTLGTGNPGEVADVLATATVEVAGAAARASGKPRSQAVAAAMRLQQRFLEVAEKASERSAEVDRAMHSIAR